MVCVEKGGRSESVEATGLRCRELSPFSFIKSRLLVAVISAPLPSLISRSTRLLGCSVRPAARQAGRQDNKYCDATLCVCFLWKKKTKTKKHRQQQKKQKLLRNLMQSAFISSSIRFPLHPAVFNAGRRRRSERLRAGWQAKKNKNYYKRWWGVMAVKHTLVHMAFLPLFITHTYCLCTEVLQVCFMCPRPPVQVQRQSPKKVDTKGQKIK